MKIPTLFQETSLFNKTKTVEASVKLLADSITSIVKGNETYTDPDGNTQTSTMGTLVQQTVNNVVIQATRDTNTPATGGAAVISSLINVATDGIKISAAKVDIEGAAVFTSGRLSQSSLNDAYDSKGSAATAKSEAITAAATDATTKANTAKSEAITAAATDATTKANTAKSEAITAAATDATTKANTAKSEAISAAATDATTKANTAKSEAISAAASDAATKYSTKDAAVTEEQYIYIQAVSGTNSVNGTTTWVTSTAESVTSDATGLTPVWTTKRPTYRSNYPVIFVAKQKKTVSGTVTCSTPTKDDTLTIIDGGHITTGTIDASKATITNINASNITSGTLAAARIDTAHITVGSLQDGSSYAKTADVPTKTSDLTNDSGFETTTGAQSKADTAKTEAITAAASDATSKANTAKTEAITAAATDAADKYSTKSAAVAEEQYIYIQAVSGTNSVNGTTTWITSTAESTSSDTANLTPVWTTKRPTYRSNYPVIFVAKQKKTVSGTVTCSTPTKDDTLTIIDGGHITTGTIDASKATITNINASNITSGTLAAARIDTAHITVGSLQDGSDYAKTADVPTKTSDLTNDSGFETTTGAQSKADTAKSEAITAAATDATTKANTAKSEAITAAATDATTKANTAKSEAITAAATDATTKANAAAKTASDYITKIDNNGVKVHATNNVNVNYTTINADGMEVFKSSTSVAKFSDTTRIGKTDSAHINMKFNEFTLVDKDNTEYVKLTDLRDENGVASFVKQYGNETSYALNGAAIDVFLYPLTLTNITLDDSSVAASNYTITDYPDENRTRVKFNNSFSIPVGGVIRIYFTSTSVNAKMFTFGSRMTPDRTGPLSSTFGYLCDGLDYCTFSAGYKNRSRNPFTVTLGKECDASANNAIAIGENCKASGINSVVIGEDNTCKWMNSIVMGLGLISGNTNEIVLGKYNYGTAMGDLLTVGRGTSDSDRSSAMKLYTNGNLWIYGSLSQNSDRRLKEHHSYLGSDACDFIRNLKPALYTKSGKRQVGFYAQDVREAEPSTWNTEMVSTVHSDSSLSYDPLTLDYISIIAPLTAYAQSLEKRVERLERELDLSN